MISDTLLAEPEATTNRAAVPAHLNLDILAERPTSEGISPHLPHIAKLHHPPYTMHFLEMINEVKRMEKALRCAQNPHHAHDVKVDAQLLLCRMSEMGDCCLRPRVTHLIRRTLVTTLFLCHGLIRRCAELADACTSRFSHPELEPSYDVMATAVLAADAAIQYLHSDHKKLYLNEIRPTLVHCMQDSESSMLETDSASDSDSDNEIVPAKRVCLCKSGSSDISCPAKENHRPGSSNPTTNTPRPAPTLKAALQTEHHTDACEQ